MLEECLRIWRQAGEKNGIASALVNLADVRFTLGDLERSQKLFSEALQVFTETGNQPGVGYSLHSIGRIMMVEGELVGARQKYQEALAIREKLGNSGFTVDSRLRLGELTIEEGRAAEAEGSIRRAVEDYRAQSDVDDQAEAQAILVRALLAQKKLAETQEVVTSARQLVAKTTNRNSRIEVTIADAQVRAALGKTAEAVALLVSVVDETRRCGFRELQLRARLALGETELKSRNPANGRTELASLERDARKKGFLLLARKAAACRKGHTV
jgi:tetratricopeptide (TPR) repeat protein